MSLQISVLLPEKTRRRLLFPLLDYKKLIRIHYSFGTVQTIVMVIYQNKLLTIITLHTMLVLLLHMQDMFGNVLMLTMTTNLLLVTGHYYHPMTMY